MPRFFRFMGGILGFVMLLFGALNIFVGAEDAVRRWLFSVSWIAMGLVFLRYAILGDTSVRFREQHDRRCDRD